MNYDRDLLSKTDQIIQDHPSHTPMSDYNIFNTLNIHEKEVSMCRFLADLLNPEGSHGCGTLFLQTFLRDVLQYGQLSDALLEHTDVSRRVKLEAGGRADILIRNAQFTLPMEIKIYGQEQEGQCFACGSCASHAKMVYLTRFSTPPSEYSRKEKDGAGLLPLEDIQCLSWGRDIYPWLSALLPQLPSSLRSIVSQYIDAICGIAEESEKRSKEETVRLLYRSPDYFRAGLQIEEAMKAAKVQLLRMTFDDLKQEMEPLLSKYGLEPETGANYYTYEERCNESFYNGTSTTFPGLNYVVKKAKFRRHSLQMWFRIEVEYSLFAGITLFDTKAQGNSSSSRGYQVYEITEHMIGQIADYLDRDIIMPSDWWITWCYPNGKQKDGSYDDVPNFKTMNACAISLADDQIRRDYVKKAVQNFERYILKYLK